VCSLVNNNVFSVLAYRNVCRIVQLRLPIERRRLDRQMTAMIFVRVITFLVSVTPYTLYRIYVIDHQMSLINIQNYLLNQLISELVTLILMYVFAVRFYFKYLKIKTIWFCFLVEFLCVLNNLASISSTNKTFH